MGCKLIIIETLTKKFTFQKNVVNNQVKDASSKTAVNCFKDKKR